jgi:AbrB family looped-hinge helix DNA binding protein
MIVTVSAKGAILIPAKLRRKYGLTAGSKLQIVDYGGGLTLVRPFDNPIEQGYGMLSGLPSLTQAIVKEHAEELEREERKAIRWSTTGYQTTPGEPG